MERELTERMAGYIRRGDHYLEEKRFDMAYTAYMDALYTLGAYLIYRDTGLLLSVGEMMRILEGRYPEVHRIIVAYEGVTSPGEDTVSSLRRDVERLRGMMNLPSSEE
ncbi:hypothetical protein E3E36_06910 [Thermococcus sp. M36]|uniref:hypothetical protein n=1 Tax=Thermococcus sp. M36 TaxID=1638261 RepID=UPI00143BCA92|nr:hypothetical protein [Thermococcus sp. M36]NJE05876.1 hypothetical protein [Thermococcus sp. M36]